MGEGTLAYELQDALARRIAPELLEQPNRERLTYEWTFLLHHLYDLEQRQEDASLSNYPELLTYARELTTNMAALDGLADELYPPSGFSVDQTPYEKQASRIEKLVKLKKLPKLVVQAPETYYAHNGLHETLWRVNRLRAIADIMDYHLENAPYEANNKVHRALTPQLRLAASVHEEIASLKPGAESQAHNAVANRLNAHIVDAESVPWYDQQKVHALFSRYDIEHRQVLGPLMGVSNDAERERAKEFMRGSQLNYYTDLLQRVEYVDELLSIADHCQPGTEQIMWSGRANMLGGTLTEIAVLGEIRDVILAKGLQLQVEARQAFLREDHNPMVRRRDISDDYISVPNFSFDHVLQYFGQRGPMSRLNVEVKKSYKPETYLATTHILNAKDHSTRREFTRKMRLLCEGKMAYYSGYDLTREERTYMEDFRRRINADRMIEELLDKSG